MASTVGFLIGALIIGMIIGTLFGLLFVFTKNWFAKRKVVKEEKKGFIDTLKLEKERWKEVQNARQSGYREVTQREQRDEDRERGITREVKPVQSDNREDTNKGSIEGRKRVQVSNPRFTLRD